jgi:hypothetical protein
MLCAKPTSAVATAMLQGQGAAAWRRGACGRGLRRAAPRARLRVRVRGSSGAAQRHAGAARRTPKSPPRPPARSHDEECPFQQREQPRQAARGRARPGQRRRRRRRHRGAPAGPRAGHPPRPGAAAAGSEAPAAAARAGRHGARAPRPAARSTGGARRWASARRAAGGRARPRGARVIRGAGPGRVVGAGDDAARSRRGQSDLTSKRGAFWREGGAYEVSDSLQNSSRRAERRAKLG